MTRSFTSRRRSSPSCGKLKCRRVRQASSGRGSVDWGYRGDVVSLAFGVWRAEARPGSSVEGAGAGDRSAAQGGSEPHAGKADPEGGGFGRLLSAARHRGCVEHVSAKLDSSQRRACRVLPQHRSTQCQAPKMADDEAALTSAIIDWARQYGRYGYRRITARLRTEGRARSGWAWPVLQHCGERGLVGHSREKAGPGCHPLAARGPPGAGSRLR